MFGFEHWDEVLVAELILQAICRQMMLIFWRSGHVHISWIPFIAESWNRVGSPIDENAELSVLVPFGNFVPLKRFPVGAERTLLIHFVDMFQQVCACCVVFAARFLPNLIDALRILRCGWGGGDLGMRQIKCRQDHHDCACSKN